MNGRALLLSVTSFATCANVVHLAALPKAWETWDNVYSNNIAVDGAVFGEAVRVHLGRLVYGSTTHSQVHECVHVDGHVCTAPPHTRRYMNVYF